MKLSELLREISVDASTDCEITSITDRADNASPDGMFVCIKGARANGHDFASVAYEHGCRVFVCEEALSLPNDALTVSVSNTRLALAMLADTFYGHPSRQMRLVGITGTKGKTTIASLFSQVLCRAGIPCGYIGTNGVQYNDVSRPLGNTTPDSITLQKTLREMLDHGVKTAVLEISSQALYQYRADGCQFDTCLFTNLHSDHIGPNEHPSFEHYKACKHRLFTEFCASLMISNQDDPVSRQMEAGALASRIVHYSTTDRNADYYAYNVLPTLTKNGYGVSFCIDFHNATHLFSVPLVGLFNATNALAVVALASEAFGISPADTSQFLAEAFVEGRTETIRLKNGAYAVIDYAHNGIGLEKLLTSLRAYKPNRLICLFGSVGERSFLRRREMGCAAARLSDLAILTSDNPGHEDPMKIIAEIAEAFQGTKTPYLTIPDRAEAIREAVRMTTHGDILVLAGKGHEAYQLIGQERLPFSERAILESI